jgi:hypothetical protein
MPRKSAAKGASGLLIPWRALSVSLLVITLGSLGTLVVTTSVKNADTLSTVALALAILSFAAQLIVTLVQGWQVSHVSGETLAALSEMKATTASVLTNQREQFNTVLEAALDRAIPAALRDVGSEESPATESELLTRDDLESALRRRVDEALRHPTEPPSNPSEVGQPGFVQRRREWLRLMNTFPNEEEGMAVMPRLLVLSRKAIASVGKMAADEASSSRSDRSVGYVHGRTSPQGVFAGLVEAGFFEVTQTVERDEGQTLVFYRLTPDGTVAAQILRAPGVPPAWAAPVLEPLTP